MSPRPSSRRALATLFLVVFVDLLGFGMVIPAMPLYAKALGAPQAWTGLLSTGYSAMQLLFAPLWGRLSDRIGRRPVLLFSVAMTAVAFAGYGAAGSFAVLLAARLFAGAATANIAIAQAYVADVTSPEQRAKGMGLIGAAFGLGFIFGPVVGGVLSSYGLSWPGYAAAVLAGLNGVAASLILPEPEQHMAAPRTRLGWMASVAALACPEVRRLVVCFFLCVLAFSAMENTFPYLLTERYGLTNRHVNFTFAYIGIWAVAMQGGLVGPLSRRFGEGKLLVVGALTQAVALAGLICARGIVGLLVAAALLALGSGMTSPAVSALLSRYSKVGERGETLGIGQSAAAFARVLGPAGGTLTYARWSPRFPYLVGAMVMALAAVIGSTIRSEMRDS